VVDMRVSNDKKIDFARIVGRDIEISLFDLVRALVHAAINGKPQRIRFNNIAGSSNRPRGAEKFNFHENILLKNRNKAQGPRFKE